MKLCLQCSPDTLAGFSGEGEEQRGTDRKRGEEREPEGPRYSGQVQANARLLAESE